MHPASRRSLCAVLRPLALPAGFPVAEACGRSSAGILNPPIGCFSIDREETNWYSIKKLQRRLWTGFSERSKLLLEGGPLILGPVNLSSATLIRNSRPNVSLIRNEATIAETEPVDAPVEKFEYQAEVSRLLDLIVHSLYGHKEVFLRELVSNASDALDKLRFLSITDPGLLSSGIGLEIKIKTDPGNGTITIIDTGIGMTKKELIDTLGTIAQSGTAKFVQSLKESKGGSAVGDDNLIGKFGVGFYSAFLVAQKVAVSTKHPKSDKQYVWEGEADSSSFTIHEETDPEKMLQIGTSITLFLKEDAKQEYSDLTKIQKLVKNYSQFISFPIYVGQERTRQIEVADDAGSEQSTVQVTDAEKENQPKKKRLSSEKYVNWELINETKPIWMRNPKEVSKEEYESFYKKNFNEYLEPMVYSHFTTEGEIEFKSILYIPGLAPFTTEETVGPKLKNIRLYVKRVFISNEFNDDLFPRYLGFIKGVIDSDDLPLNVSREILQESRVVHLMKKRLVRKTLEMIEDIAKKDNKADYKKFWDNFGKYIKMGCIEDAANHKHLSPLLRFYSSKHEDELVSLKSYVENMKADQKSIYFLPADSLKSAKNAPFLEEFAKRDFEVLFLVDPVDEVAISNLKTFDGKKFADITKEELDLDEKNEDKKKQVEREFRELCEWIKEHLGDKVEKVQISKRAMSSPCVLVAGKLGLSANMERILRAQVLGDSATAMGALRGTRILEINPNHSIMKDLNEIFGDTYESGYARQTVDLLYETSLLSIGFSLQDPAKYGTRVFKMMSTTFNKQHESNTFAVPTTEVVDSPIGVKSELSEQERLAPIEAEVVEQVDRDIN